ncbi:4'-phosphopantetheinyl transferase superfamily [Scheffersomyces amazonensis]|uniref:4'-phosphopantetheinyl transferase superfamily n=1 Tax=Scheffersomyces amazonensis TaxID=1078765 RepID=UPI00315CDC44
MVRIPITRGIGVDITSITRFKKLLSKDHEFVKRLSLRILHPQYELKKFEELQEITNTNQGLIFFAGTWASKEALYKSLSIEGQKKFRFKDWYRKYDENGKPSIHNDQYHEDHEFLLTVSHDEDVLVANVVRQEYVTIGDSD